MISYKMYLIILWAVPIHLAIQQLIHCPFNILQMFKFL
jgi:hypothetical protein